MSMNSLYRCSKIYIIFVGIFFIGCSTDKSPYSPEILAIKNYQSNRVFDESDIYIDGSFTVSPSPEGRDQLKELAKITTEQSKHTFEQYVSRYSDIHMQFWFYEKTDVINEDFTDIYDSWGSIAISPDSGEVPLTLRDVGKNAQLVSIRASKTSNRSDAGCRFRLETKIYHHYWIIGSKEESFVEKVLDIPCSSWTGWE